MVDTGIQFDESGVLHWPGSVPFDDYLDELLRRVDLLLRRAEALHSDGAKHSHALRVLAEDLRKLAMVGLVKYCRQQRIPGGRRGKYKVTRGSMALHECLSGLIGACETGSAPVTPARLVKSPIRKLARELEAHRTVRKPAREIMRALENLPASSAAPQAGALRVDKAEKHSRLSRAALMAQEFPHMTQKAIAEAVGLSPSTLSRSKVVKRVRRVGSPHRPSASDPDDE